MSTTRATRHLHAPRSRVYAALIDPDAIAQWKVPRSMTCEVHEFDGESFRISLTYDSPDEVGKSSAHTDTYRGRFVELVRDERVVEVDEFETDDPSLAGPMTITITLSDADDGTDLLAVHEGLPAGVAPEDNEVGWRESLDRLAELVEDPTS
ncbi:MAG: SRPBCC family protein [Marmoricola sp.]